MLDKIQFGATNNANSAGMTSEENLQSTKYEVPRDSFKKSSTLSNVEKITKTLSNYDINRMADKLSDSPLYGFSLGSISLAALKNPTPSVDANIVNIDTGYEESFRISPEEFIRVITSLRDNQIKQCPQSANQINDSYRKILDILYDNYNIQT